MDSHASANYWISYCIVVGVLHLTVTIDKYGLQ